MVRENENSPAPAEQAGGGRTFVGLAMSSTMFDGEELLIVREQLNAGRLRRLLAAREVVSCCNPSHEATIVALREKFGIEIPIPETAPKVVLEPRDILVVLQARFNRRLAEGERFSAEEVRAANFEFAAYSVISPEGLSESARAEIGCQLLLATSE